MCECECEIDSETYSFSASEYSTLNTLNLKFSNIYSESIVRLIDTLRLFEWIRKNCESDK